MKAFTIQHDTSMTHPLRWVNGAAIHRQRDSTSVGQHNGMNSLYIYRYYSLASTGYQCCVAHSKLFMSSCIFSDYPK